MGRSYCCPAELGCELEAYAFNVSELSCQPSELKLPDHDDKRLCLSRCGGRPGCRTSCLFIEIAIDPWRHKTTLPLSYIYTLIPLHMVYLIYLFTAIIVRARVHVVVVVDMRGFVVTALITADQALGGAVCVSLSSCECACVDDSGIGVGLSPSSCRGWLWSEAVRTQAVVPTTKFV